MWQRKVIVAKGGGAKTLKRRMSIDAGELRENGGEGGIVPLWSPVVVVQEVRGNVRRGK